MITVLLLSLLAQSPQRTDGGVYGQPNKDPRTLQQAQVDRYMWPIVSRINKSGWLWTTESCQGHDTPVRRPLVLGLITNDPGRFFALLAKVHAANFKGERPDESQDPQGLSMEIHWWKHPRLAEKDRSFGKYQFRLVVANPEQRGLALRLLTDLVNDPEISR